MEINLSSRSLFIETPMKNTKDSLQGKLILQNNGNSSEFWKKTQNLSEGQVKKATSIVSMRQMHSSDNTNIFSGENLKHIYDTIKM